MTHVNQHKQEKLKAATVHIEGAVSRVLCKGELLMRVGAFSFSATCLLSMFSASFLGCCILFINYSCCCLDLCLGGRGHHPDWKCLFPHHHPTRRQSRANWWLGTVSAKLESSCVPPPRPRITARAPLVSGYCRCSWHCRLVFGAVVCCLEWTWARPVVRPCLTCRATLVVCRPPVEGGCISCGLTLL